MSSQFNISPAQCRAARGLLGWTKGELAKIAGVGLTTVNNFEADKRQTMRSSKYVIKQALESAGVELVQDGVRLRH